jgi:Fur family ferric uptake transcriptional regulator
MHRRILAECRRCLTVHGVTVDQGVDQILQLFFATDSHVSVDDIERGCRSRGLAVDRSVIEHTMRLLVEYGFATRKQFGDHVARYEHLHPGEHHDHFYCLRCGTIIEFYAPQLEELQATEARIRGFHAFSHRLQIHGLCDRCFGEASETLQPLSAVRRGGAFRIVEIAGREPGRCRRRFTDMGLIPDARGEVISNTMGVVVVNLAGNRLALGRGQAEQVRVELRN